MRMPQDVEAVGARAAGTRAAARRARPGNRCGRGGRGEATDAGDVEGDDPDGWVERVDERREEFETDADPVAQQERGPIRRPPAAPDPEVLTPDRDRLGRQVGLGRGHQLSCT